MADPGTLDGDRLMVATANRCVLPESSSVRLAMDQPMNKAIAALAVTVGALVLRWHRLRGCADPAATTAYKLSGSLPVVGTSTGVFAAIGKPVVVVTPLPPRKAAALELTSTPSVSGAAPIEATRVAVVPTLVCELKYPAIYFSPRWCQEGDRAGTRRSIGSSSRPRSYLS